MARMRYANAVNDAHRSSTVAGSPEGGRGKESGAGFPTWRKRARIVMMVVALVLAAKLFFESRVEPARQSIGDPVGDWQQSGLSASQVLPPLREAALLAAHCRPPAGASGEVEVEMQFESDGHASHVQVLTDQVRGTQAASCIELMFQRANLPAFNGPALQLRQSFSFQG